VSNILPFVADRKKEGDLTFFFLDIFLSFCTPPLDSAVSLSFHQQHQIKRILSFQHHPNMASMLGKRKRRTPDIPKGDRDESGESDASGLDAQEIFRRHFETQFTPLPAVQKSLKPVAEESADESEEGSDWEGISEDEENAVQVVEHTEAHARTAAMSKEELKSFMVFLFSAGLKIPNQSLELETP